ncbi:hypothetical protein AA101099_1571 [Neoasaia chiangmaiensis NBRC 101099]|nr:hypothetical protein [Neoasaia chiangmaiensis]GBR39229.1 hypothetical protein AA101099_1571 [Neoasaia chiangmaiensis NBRC 101099]GEN15511.1 hypothetical protein NCH01_19420 [Neoasaia chiangmaiensis]
MRLTRYLPALCLMTPLVAQAQITPSSSAINLAGFNLLETPQGHAVLEPSTQGRGGTIASPAGVTLGMDAVRSSNYHTVRPAIALQETQRFRPQDGVTVYDAALHLDRLPRRGHTVIAEITADDQPRLELAVEGDTVIVTDAIPGAAPFRAVGGTISPSRNVAYRIAILPNGGVGITVNGIKGVYALPVQEALSFRTGLMVSDDIGHRPDIAQVTFMRLTNTHRPTIGGTI